MTNAIEQRIFFPHAPAVVWDYLTKPELLEQWLMKNDIAPVVGHRFKFTNKPMPELNFDGVFYCQITEVVPLKKLSYTWKFGPGDGTLNNSEVVWTLKEKDNGTELHLLHTAFEGAHALPLFAALDKGWLDSIQKMLKKINIVTDGTTKA